ncbi:MAG: 16S rRNA (guanine(966)-N(2))-methyltransferase RsmD [Nitrospirae bacterium]|nr:16S rRNA (guanine(966)-N(2))-methyltransferase RsmD [Nitrospirota bacterium]
MLRIISGKSKGRHLRVPAGDRIRPTSDKVRESMFNIVGHEYIVNSAFLDLFSGSGAVGIEAVSRGARHATLVENNVRHLKTIKDNIKTCGYEKEITVLFGDVMTVIEEIIRGSMQYNIVFADPPYNYNNWPDLLSKIINNVNISGYGFLIIEHSSKISMPEALTNFEDYGKYVYGDTTLTVYRRHVNNSNLSGNI